VDLTQPLALRVSAGRDSLRSVVGSCRTAAPRLPRSFFARDARTVAKQLLGKVLVHVDGGVRRAARIVETEAYMGEDDQASHARFGPTPRAAIMFGPPGVAYVYLVYGLSHCFNVVTGQPGEASAVLVRACEPVDDCLHRTTGPGNLCRALALRRETHNGVDLTGDLLFLEDAPLPAERVLASARVNVGFAGSWAEKPWRFSLAGNRFVSKPWPERGGRRR
jgi:DNA-3-methyladenine glycosylase